MPPSAVTQLQELRPRGAAIQLDYAVSRFHSSGPARGCQVPEERRPGANQPTGGLRLAALPSAARLCIRAHVLRCANPSRRRRPRAQTVNPRPA